MLYMLICGLAWNYHILLWVHLIPVTSESLCHLLHGKSLFSNGHFCPKAFAQIWVIVCFTNLWYQYWRITILRNVYILLQMFQQFIFIVSENSPFYCIRKMPTHCIDTAPVCPCKPVLVWYACKMHRTPCNVGNFGCTKMYGEIFPL